MNHAVRVLDMFNYMNEEANSTVKGFETAELAIEYARRRTVLEHRMVLKQVVKLTIDW